MRKKNTKNLFAITLIALLFPASALAASFQAGDRALISVPVNDDLYVVGGQVVVESRVNGDFVAAGGEIEVNSEISNDLIVAGGRVLVNGNVGDDIRVFGGEIEIGGKVTDDLIVNGGRIRILANAEIGGDLIANGGEIRIDGKVDGGLIANGGRIVLNGSIGKDAEINGGLLEVNGQIQGSSKIVAEEIVLGANAKFASKVEYWTKKGEINFGAANAVYSKELGKKFHKQKFGNKGAIFGFGILFFLSGALIIFLLLFARKFFREASHKLEKNVWKSFGIGVLYFLLTPIVAIILFVTVIGIPLGLIVGAAYGLSVILVTPFVAIILASLWEKHGRNKWGKWQFFGISVVVYAALKILISIPVLGGLVIIFVVIPAFGAFLIRKIEIAKKFCK